MCGIHGHLVHHEDVSIPGRSKEAPVLVEGDGVTRVDAALQQLQSDPLLQLWLRRRLQSDSESIDQHKIALDQGGKSKHLL